MVSRSSKVDEGLFLAENTVPGPTREGCAGPEEMVVRDLPVPGPTGYGLKAVVGERFSEGYQLVQVPRVGWCKAYLAYRIVLSCNMCVPSAWSQCMPIVGAWASPMKPPQNTYHCCYKPLGRSRIPLVVFRVRSAGCAGRAVLEVGLGFVLEERHGDLQRQNLSSVIQGVWKIEKVVGHLAHVKMGRYVPT